MGYRNRTTSIFCLSTNIHDRKSTVEIERQILSKTIESGLSTFEACNEILRIIGSSSLTMNEAFCTVKNLPLALTLRISSENFSIIDPIDSK